MQNSSFLANSSLLLLSSDYNPNFKNAYLSISKKANTFFVQNVIELLTRTKINLFCYTPESNFGDLDNNIDYMFVIPPSEDFSPRNEGSIVVGRGQFSEIDYFSIKHSSIYVINSIDTSPDCSGILVDDYVNISLCKNTSDWSKYGILTTNEINTSLINYGIHMCDDYFENYKIIKTHKGCVNNNKVVSNSVEKSSHYRLYPALTRMFID